MKRLLPALWSCSLALLAVESSAVAQTGEKKPQQKRSQPNVDWSLFRGDPGLQGRASGSIPDKLELAWSFKTGDAILSSPVVVNGTVYFGSSDQSVYAVDLLKGQKRWSFRTDDMVDAPPLVLDGRVYIGSSDFFFYALDAETGKLAWKFETGDKILGGANFVKSKEGNRIIVGSYDAKLYCFDTKGKKLWEYETGNYINGTPAILGNRIVFGGCDAVLHVVSAKTGAKVDQVELGSDCQVANSVAVAEDKAYFGHYGNEFLCIDFATGERKWSYPSRNHPFFSSPALSADRVVFGGRDRRLHCVGRRDGKKIWTFPTKRKIDGSPVICGGKVVFGSGDGRLYVLRLSDGKELFKYEIGKSILSSPAIVNGMILIGASDGRMYAFREATEKSGR